MPSLDEFADSIARSGLVPAGELERARGRFSAGTDATVLAQALIAGKALTPYQARKLLAGTTKGFFVAGYRILQPLGEGGGGKVFLAAPRDGGPPVALKVLPPKKARELGRALESFQREMDLSRRVRHPNVAKTLEVGEDGGVFYMVLEYVPGESLYNLVKLAGPLPVPRAARLFVKILDGLEAAHQAGLIHRDIKPSNLMITPDGDAKILDLGIALALEAPGQAGKPDSLFGTLDYTSPEQLGDATQVDARSDLYSLGCSLYFAVAGRPPFEGGDAINKIFRHRLEDPPPLETLVPGIPPGFSAAVHRLMAKNPELRPQSAHAARGQIARWAPTPRNVDSLPEGPAADTHPPPPLLRDFEDADFPESTVAPRSLKDGKGPTGEFPWVVVVILIAAVLGSLAVLGIALMI